MAQTTFEVGKRVIVSGKRKATIISISSSGKQLEVIPDDGEKLVKVSASKCEKARGRASDAVKEKAEAFLQGGSKPKKSKKSPSKSKVSSKTKPKGKEKSKTKGKTKEKPSRQSAESKKPKSKSAGKKRKVANSRR